MPPRFRAPARGARLAPCTLRIAWRTALAGRLRSARLWTDLPRRAVKSVSRPSQRAAPAHEFAAVPLGGYGGTHAWRSSPLASISRLTLCGGRANGMEPGAADSGGVRRAPTPRGTLRWRVGRRVGPGRLAIRNLPRRAGAATPNGGQRGSEPHCGARPHPSKETSLHGAIGRGLAPAGCGRHMA